MVRGWSIRQNSELKSNCSLAYLNKSCKDYGSREVFRDRMDRVPNFAEAGLQQLQDCQDFRASVVYPGRVRVRLPRFELSWRTATQSAAQKLPLCYGLKTFTLLNTWCICKSRSRTDKVCKLRLAAWLALGQWAVTAGYFDGQVTVQGGDILIHS